MSRRNPWFDFLSQVQEGESGEAPAGFQLPDWLPPQLVHAWSAVEAYPLAAAAVLIVVFFVAGKVVELVLKRGLSRLTARTRTDIDDQLIGLARRPAFITVFFFGLALAIRVLGLPATITERTVDVLQTLVVFYWFGAAAPACRLLLDALGALRDRFPLVEERTIPLFDILSKLLLFGGATYLLINIWDIDPTPWLASAGVIGIAVGFAARDTLANLFAGIFIIADSPYKLGDYIVLDTGERGRVTHVGIRSTRLLTRDDIEVTLPNAVIGNAKIINESGGPWEKERIRIKVGVAYGSDVDQVCELLKQLAVEHDHICPEPKPRVRMRGFGDSSLDFELLCWIDEPELRGKLSHELYMDVYKCFRREGVEIPFPQRDLWVRGMPPKGADEA